MHLFGCLHAFLLKQTQLFILPESSYIHHPHDQGHIPSSVNANELLSSLPAAPITLKPGALLTIRMLFDCRVEAQSAVSTITGETFQLHVHSRGGGSELATEEPENIFFVRVSVCSLRSSQALLLSIPGVFDSRGLTVSGDYRLVQNLCNSFNGISKAQAQDPIDFRSMRQ